MKQGVCSIRQRVVVDTQQDDRKCPHSRSTMSEQTKQQSRPHHPDKQSVRVMVTVADVADGHLFWIDGADTFPFTLQAVSASVAITNISIDKLKAILPRTQLVALGKASNQMAALYKQQCEMAKQAVATLMNEKRAAQMGMAPNPTFLPMLSFQSPRKVIQHSATTSNSSKPSDLDTFSSSETAISFSRLLMAKPVDLVVLQRQEQRGTRRHQEQSQSIDAENHTGRHGRDWNTPNDIDTAYREQHLSEHYQLDNGFPSSTLVGSFPDDFALRHRRRSEQTVLGTAGRQSSTRENTPALPPESAVPSTPTAKRGVPLKEDECIQPEPVSAHDADVGSSDTPTLCDSASRIHLAVEVPLLHDESHARSPRVPTPPNGSRPKSRGLSPSQRSSFSPRSPRHPAVLREANSAEGDDGFWDLEIDLRALLRAEMNDIEAPMRTMKLEPSRLKANSRGKHFDASPLPPTSPDLLCDQAPRKQPQHPITSYFTSSRLGNSKNPFKMFPRSKPAIQTIPVAPVTAKAQPQEMVEKTRHEQASLRKQGFMCVVTMTAPTTPLSASLPRVLQNRRRFYALVDSDLLEYSENVAIAELHATHWLHKYSLDGRSGDSQVSDVPMLPGEAEATLRMSFLLAVDSTTQLILTTENPSEKKKWMAELRQACTLGPRLAPLHQKIKAAPTGGHIEESQQKIRTNQSQDPKRLGDFLSAPDDQAQTLEVEYFLG